jgi:hypothetical protein
VSSGVAEYNTGLISGVVGVMIGHGSGKAASMIRS